MTKLMARLPVKPTTLRALFARSGNVCAYPGCVHELVNAKNQFVAEVCHIEAAMPKGERYNTEQTDEQRRSFANLLILCHKHHVETDDVNEFSVDKLKEMKALHEAKNGKKAYKVDESVIFLLEAQMLKYWSALERVNQTEHSNPDMAVSVDTRRSVVELFAECSKQMSSLERLTDFLRDSDNSLSAEARSFLEKIGYSLEKYDAVPYFENPFVNKAWETHNLGIPNHFTNLRLITLQIEVGFLSEYLKTNSSDGHANFRFQKAKEELLEMSRSAGYAD